MFFVSVYQQLRDFKTLETETLINGREFPNLIVDLKFTFICIALY